MGRHTLPKLQSPMRLTRCPICRNHISLEAIVQDEAGRELLKLLVKLDTQTGAALVSYLGLFRPPTRDLANERALRLAKETLDLPTRADEQAAMTCLAIALSETVEALRSKEPQQPLKNHNYLKKVLESIQARPVVVRTETAAIAPRSKTGQAYMTLENLKQSGA